MHPDDLETVRTSIQQPEIYYCPKLEYRIVRPSGETVYISRVREVVYNASGKPVKALGTIQDITDRKKGELAIQQSEERFKALVQNGSDLIVVMDEKARFTYVSDNVTCQLGYTPEEVVGRSAFEFMHAEDTEKAVAEFLCLLHDPQAAKSMEHRFLNKAGNWVWLESKGSNHKGHQRINGILINARNINDRVSLQKKLEEEQQTKQREITAAIIKTQEQERSQLGLELHDNVNQVLTTVKLYNEMFLTGCVQDKTLLEKSAQYLQNCIDEIRSISKRLSSPTLGNISLCDSIKELVDSINIAGRLQIDFVHNFSDCSCVTGDLYLAVYRIVQESLNNVINFSGAAKARIKITRNEKALTVLISDNGAGFDTDAKKPGMGITNIKTRAEAFNARFSIKSAPGKGCRIQLVFPL